VDRGMGEIDYVPDGGAPVANAPSAGTTPPAGNAPAAGPGGGAVAATDDCGTPRSMEKVISGSFKGGLGVGDYYPGLARAGYPANAGPFDLGNRAGSSVQLLGVIPSPCLPSQYRFAQSAHSIRARQNGVAAPEEGTTFDDVARSHQDAEHAPFRQEFLGGSGAPLGYIISMLDPPSTPYDASTVSAEFDAEFTTSLIGPTGRQSVNWAVSVRVTNGAVTRNTVT